ncbi:PRD domain-containing protein [Pediococcus damnosus]|uniref:PRD domain-containing protein n=1 Tax=Pediococcus damnosus TaxID=51663 RepID=UPI0009BDB7FA
MCINIWLIIRHLGKLDTYRFITHLKFFAQRVLQNKHYDDDADEDLLQTLKKKYAVAYNCARKIQTFVRKKYDYEISSTELLYLTVHIRRLVKNL